MMEITKTLNLKENEINVIDFHSFMNVVNIVVSELYLLGDSLGDFNYFEGLSKQFIKIADEIKETDTPAPILKKLVGIDEKVIKTIDNTLSENGLNLNEEGMASYENLKSIFRIINVRMNELIERIETPLVWKVFDVEQLKSNFMNVLAAIEKNSKGRYKIIFNIAEHEEKQYLIHLDIDSIDGQTIFMPSVLQDIMRDLIANARKYTTPGGTIDAGLIETNSELIFAVKDNGIGIPEHQIDKVVDFGFRANNVLTKPTFGGGFGLTKAYYFVKKLGGQFWINSELDKGTEIKFRIPKN